MPKVEETDCEDNDDSSLHQNKLKKGVYYPVPLRGFDQIESFESYSSLLNPWRNGVSTSNDEIEANSNCNRPPLLKSSRGRVQVLPSKFSDSVIDSWKKEKSEFDNDDDDQSSFGNAETKRRMKFEGSNFGGQLFKKQRMEEDKFSPYSLEIEVREIGSIGYKGYDSNNKMVSSLRSSLTSASGGKSRSLLETEEYSPRLVGKYNGREKLGKVKFEKKGFYRAEDFVLNDIVWAKCGKKFPAWPAVVIDPLWQAPESVLMASVPGTICVMFYGYSKDGKRVLSLSLCVLLGCRYTIYTPSILN